MEHATPDGGLQEESKFHLELNPASMAIAERTVERHHREFFTKFLHDLVKPGGKFEENKHDGLSE